MSTTLRDNIDQLEEFTYEDGLNFAIAFTASDDEPEPILDKSIGELVVQSYSWGYEDETSQKTYSRKERLSTHICTEEELGIKDGNATFFKITEKFEPSLRRYKKKFLCVDKEDLDKLYIHGNFNSDVTRLLQIQLQLCEGHDYCNKN